MKFLALLAAVFSVGFVFGVLATLVLLTATGIIDETPREDDEYEHYKY